MKIQPDKIRKMILARVEDRLGDTILTLPLAGILKSRFPNMQVTFLGDHFIKPIVKKSAFVDAFYDRRQIEDLDKYNADAIMLLSPYSDLSKAVWRAKVPIRIGTARRWFHWLHANIRVSLKDRAVNLHETQLVTSFLPPLGIEDNFNIDELHQYYGWQTGPKLPFPEVISDTKPNIILHPKSKGTAPEWPLEHYYKLASILDDKNLNVIISGTEKERDTMQQTCSRLFELPNITDIVGRYSLADYIAIVEQADCLVASSTGPMHLAAIAGINTIGIFAPVRPYYPTRWRPIGKHVKVLCKGEPTYDKNQLDKINAITPHEVKETIEEMLEGER